MNDRYDVVVVGAGPAGTTAGRLLAERGFSVLTLEKDRDVGMPVRCGEAVSNRSLESIVPIEPRWIAATIRRFRLVAPNGAAVEPDLGGHGYVLERRIFDYDLARMASDAGAEVVTKAYVHGLLRENDAVSGVRFVWKGEPREVRARIIVGADGVESRVGKWAGIDTTTRLDDMECCAQMTLTGVDIEDDACEFHFGRNVAPAGYLWVFPKGNRTANVGVGISGTAARHRSPISYLRAFVESRYPRSSVLTTVAGGVPCAATLDHIVKENVVLVGDAAHQVNPISGGGITSGMIGASIAADAITDALNRNEPARLGRYEAAWDKRVGGKHRTYHRMKTVVSTFTDETLDGIAADLQKMPPDKRTIWGVFRTALVKHPAIVWEMVKTFGL